MKKVEISQEEFKEYYITQNHSLEECSKHFGLSTTGIARRIEEWKLHKPNSLKGKRIGESRRFEIDKDALRQAYCVEHLSIEECAKKFGCVRQTLKKELVRQGLYTPPTNYDKDILALAKKGKSNAEIVKALGVSVATVKRSLKRQSFRRPNALVKETISRRVKELYQEGKLVPLRGEDNPCKRPEIREKISTSIKNSPAYVKGKEQAAQTNLKRYGSENAFSSPIIKEKIKQTNLERYGTTSAMQNGEVRDRAIKTLKTTLAKKWDYETRIANLELEHKALDRKLTPKELMSIWGLSESNTYRFMRKYKLEKYVELSSSALEMETENLLKEHGIKYEKHRRDIIPPQELDFFIPKFNLAIETNDVWTHNASRNAFGGEPKPKDYHIKKSMACREQGIRLIHVWDYELWDKRQRPILESMILSACGKCEPIYARKCKLVVKESKDLVDFFNENHIQGHRGGKVAYCLEWQGEIVFACIFGKPYFSKQEVEIIRVATKRGYRVIGGLSRVWKHFVEDNSPNTAVCYIDFNYYDGRSMTQLGFEYTNCSAGLKYYIPGKRLIVGRNPSKNKEMKKLLHDGKAWEVWNAGVLVYTWHKPPMV